MSKNIFMKFVVAIAVMFAGTSLCNEGGENFLHTIKFL
jgi:hypothetical protein